MEIRQLTLVNFRNYAEQNIDFFPGVNLVSGLNAQGKTNLLEAIYLLCGSRSWRSGKRGDLIRFHEARAEIKARVFSRGREFEIVLLLPASGRGSILINQIRIKNRYELSDVIRCVLFSPEDLFLVRGGASVRRDFIDGGLSQLSPRYGELLERYSRLIDQKNKLLKAGDDRARLIGILPEYNERLVQLGARLIGQRARFCRALEEKCRGIHAELSGKDEKISLRYQTVSAVDDPFASPARLEEQLRKHMESHMQAELDSGSCLSGAHRDELLIEIDDKNARGFASQGQARTAAITLKLGVRELFYEDAGEYPLLLLDDVLSELDERRQRLTSTRILNGQTVITCCQLPEYLAGARVMEVKNGNIIGKG